ncbi:MAG: DUF58 domain-containing protein [Bacteroidia bacterium]|jgi:hypothetical protein|nr:DUF58 domain-containing protein [Bacteroidia bacterium]
MFQRKLAYWLTYTVVRWQFILGLAVIWAAWKWLRSTYYTPDSLHWEILTQFLPVAGWILAAIAGFSVLTAVLAWVWFLFRYRNGKTPIRLRMGEGNRAEAGPVRVSVQVDGLLRPFLGQVQARLVFKDMAMSSVITLNENVRNGGLLRTGVSGTALTDMYNRGATEAEELQLLFIDPLRLLVMPFTIEINRQMNTLARKLDEQALPVQPNRTEQQLERIETPKRVEGEMLSYKDFEAGDDVRRIVWKIYARNGELVVRIPETMDPYASHLVLYASFYNVFSGPADMPYNEQLLNAYKDIVRQLLDNAQAGEYAVRMPADQQVHELSDETPEKKLLMQVSLAHWQNDMPPAQFVNVRDAALVCLPSTVPVADAEKLLWQLPEHVPVVGVAVSGSIPAIFPIAPGEVFFRRVLRPAQKLRTMWTFATLRRKLLANEKQLELLLHRRGNSQFINAPQL